MRKHIIDRLYFNLHHRKIVNEIISNIENYNFDLLKQTTQYESGLFEVSEITLKMGNSIILLESRDAFNTAGMSFGITTYHNLYINGEYINTKKTEKIFSMMDKYFNTPVSDIRDKKIQNILS